MTAAWFHWDGDDLVLTHYCAAGNQPHMRLDRATASRSRLRFDFAHPQGLSPEQIDAVDVAQYLGAAGQT